MKERKKEGLVGNRWTGEERGCERQEGICGEHRDRGERGEEKGKKDFVGNRGKGEKTGDERDKNEIVWNRGIGK